MRIVFVYLTLLALVLVSLGAGFVASDWPRWCSRAHWCAPGWPRQPEQLQQRTRQRNAQRNP